LTVAAFAVAVFAVAALTVAAFAVAVLTVAAFALAAFAVAGFAGAVLTVAALAVAVFAVGTLAFAGFVAGLATESFAAVFFVTVARTVVAATARCAAAVPGVTWIPCWSSERSTTFIRLGVISACTNATRNCSLSTEPLVVPIRTSA